MSRTPKTLLLGCAAIAATSIVAAPQPQDADAATDYDLWHGLVQRASDGDTMRVDVDGDGLGPVPIRLIGVNATELGECSADVATDELDRVAVGKRVTLEVPSGSSVDRYGRYHAYVTTSDGVDVSAALLEAGTVWPVPKDSRASTTLEYYRVAQAARLAGVGIWSSNACGAPPTPDAEIEMRVLRNPDGLDSDDPNKEWVKLLNVGQVAVDLAGWNVRSTGEEKYWFPAGTRLDPGDWLKIHPGSGNQSARHHYWGLDRPMYSNTGAESVVLIDSLGNLRSFKQTPCPENCTDELRGKVELRVNYDAPGGDSVNPNGEWVDILNTSDSRIDLVDYILINDSHRFVPGGGGRLDPGERMRVYVGSGQSTETTVKYWGKSHGILANGSDEVVLRSIDGVRVAAISWPCDGCEASLPDVNVVFVNPDAPGVDEEHLDEEYVIIRNDSGSAVDLRDWAVRSGTNWFRFGDRVLEPGYSIRLVVGRGQNRLDGTEHVIHWRRTEPALPNSSAQVQLIGPNLGVADCYGWGSDPCRRPQRTRLISIRVTADAPGSDTINANGETVRIKNKDSRTVDLSGSRLVHNGRVYVFPDGTTVQPEHAVTVHAGHGSDTLHHKYWGTDGGTLANQGGLVAIYDTDGYRMRQYRYD